MGETIHILEIEAAVGKTANIQGFLALEAPFGWEERPLGWGRMLFVAQNNSSEYMEKLAARARELFPDAEIRRGEAEAEDWTSAWKEFFTPVECGGFVVLPPWLADSEFAGIHKIVIEPKSAFGTGHHASTTLCLKALDSLLAAQRLHAGQKFLDLGCGTGVLGIGAALAGLQGLGLDIDPLAVGNALENISLNRAENMRALCGGLEKAGGCKFDLVMANILAGPLIDMAPEICACLKPGACLILSGILDRQAEKVAAAYRACISGEPEIFGDGEWRALVWA